MGLFSYTLLDDAKPISCLMLYGHNHWDSWSGSKNTVVKIGRQLHFARVEEALECFVVEMSLWFNVFHLCHITMLPAVCLPLPFMPCS